MHRPGMRLVPMVALTWLVSVAVTARPNAAAGVAVLLWLVTLLPLVAMLVLPRSTRAGRQIRTTVAVVLIVSAAAGAATATHVAFASSARAAVSALGLTGGRAITVEALVVGKVEQRTGGVLAFDAVARVISVGERDHLVGSEVAISVDPARVDALSDLDVGASILASGTARPGYEGSRGVLEISASRGLTVTASPDGIFDAASHLRRQLVASAKGLPGVGAELIPGLAIGDTSLVSPDLDAAMKSSSLSHLTAVSGANCALVVGIAFALAAMGGASRRVRVLCGLVALALFVLIVTPEPSVVRAGAMAAIAMLAVLWGRVGAGLAVLSLAVTVLLISDPWLGASLGFALSAAATGALLLLARPLADGLSRWLPKPLALALAVPLAAQLVCGPLLVLIAPTVPLYGVVANLLAAPAAPIATVVGLAACVTPWVPWLQDGLVTLAWLPASWIAETARVSAALPGASVVWLDGVLGSLLLSLVGGAVVLVLVRTGHSRASRVATAGSAVILAIVFGVISGAAVLGSFAGRLTLPSEWNILFCDVGQGDAILIRSAGVLALVDTGPDPVALERCLTRVGVSEIDLLVLSHFDADHVGGVAAVTGKVGAVLYGPPSPEGGAIVQELVDGGAQSVEASAGVSGNIGEARWRVLWPRQNDRTTPPGNDASVVIDIRGGDIPAMLMLGDLSTTPQQALLSGGSLDVHYDVVKVAHHGSADQSMKLYEQVAPAIAVIPVGADNRYGHPRDEILGVLDSIGASVARTDINGIVALTSTTTGVSIWRERSGDGATANVSPDR
ncbi:ComEC/Rec2 family competence protein (plasmid) [Coraliomargarita sp. W4R53]